MRHYNLIQKNTYVTLFIAIISLSITIRINVVGILTLSDVILIAIFPIVFFRSWPDFVEVKKFYLFASIWILGCIVTDIYRQSQFDDYIRGMAMILFFIINFSSISAICNWKIERIVFFILMLYVASAISVYYGVSIESKGGFFGDAWKFGYGISFTVIVFIISAFLMKQNYLRIIGIILPFLAMSINLYLNARSLAGITAIAAVSNAMVGRPGKVTSPVKVFFVLSICAIGGYLLIQVYKYLAGSGFMGEAAQLKYMLQSNSNLNIILSGRSEVLASVEAIKDSPIFGHGSWARDKKYFELMVVAIEKAGGARNYLVDDLIPSHSHIFGAWVQHGIAGALFWFWVMILSIMAFYRSISKPSFLSGFTAFVSMTMLWNVFFSPFGLEKRVIDPAIICYLIMVLNSDNLAAAALGRSRGAMRRLMPGQAWRPGAVAGRSGAGGPLASRRRSGAFRT